MRVKIRKIRKILSLERTGWKIPREGENCTVGELKTKSWAEGDTELTTEMDGQYRYQTRWEEIWEGRNLIICTDENPEWLWTESLWFNWVNFTHPTWMCAYVYVGMHSHVYGLTERRGDERKIILAPTQPSVCSVSLSMHMLWALWMIIIPFLAVKAVFQGRFTFKVRRKQVLYFGIHLIPEA